MSILHSLAVMFGLFAAAYLLYGRIKRKPLIGDYKPGTPAYNEFIRIIDGKWYPALTAAAVIFSVIDLIIVVATLINGPYPKVLLAAAPVILFAVFLLGLLVVKTRKINK